MIKIQKLALALSALTLAGISMAQKPMDGRAFSYSGIDAVNDDYSSAGNASFKVRSRATVVPYLYIQGNFGAEWKVTGWGAGQNTQSEKITVYHNETLTFILDGFDDLKKIEGTKTGSQTIGLSGAVELSNSAGSAYIPSMPAAKLNGNWGPVSAGDTGGKFDVKFSRTITLDPGVGPGTYENVGTVVFSRN